MPARLMQGDSLTMLRLLPDASARCCVTSPPYWGLRDYGVACQRGLEATPALYVAGMVEVFREVRRVLMDDGTLWLNLGDSYCSVAGSQTQGGDGQMADRSVVKARAQVRDGKAAHGMGAPQRPPSVSGVKPKDLIGIPWRVAFALQEDGWYLRSDIIWHKPNPMPESVRDRPTKAHEYLFLLSKRERYYYDASAIAEALTTDPRENYPARAEIIGSGGLESLEQGSSPQQRSSGGFPPRKSSGNKERKLGDERGRPGSHLGGSIPWEGSTRNARSVWTIATQPYAEAHFATFPEELARRCILAGSAPGDTVLDPFGGSGTVAQVATGNGRNAIHIDINPEYCAMARRRIGPLLCESEDDFTAQPKGAR